MQNEGIAFSKTGLTYDNLSLKLCKTQNQASLFPGSTYFPSLSFGKGKAVVQSTQINLFFERCQVIIFTNIFKIMYLSKHTVGITDILKSCYIF